MDGKRFKILKLQFDIVFSLILVFVINVLFYTIGKRFFFDSLYFNLTVCLLGFLIVNMFEFMIVKIKFEEIKAIND